MCGELHTVQYSSRSVVVTWYPKVRGMLSFRQGRTYSAIEHQQAGRMLLLVGRKPQLGIRMNYAQMQMKGKEEEEANIKGCGKLRGCVNTCSIWERERGEKGFAC